MISVGRRVRQLSETALGQNQFLKSPRTSQPPDKSRLPSNLGHGRDSSCSPAGGLVNEEPLQPQSFEWSLEFGC